MTHLLGVTRGLLYVLIFFLPLIALPFTIDALEINKQTWLVVMVFAAALTWIGSMLASRAPTLRRGWLNALPVLLLAAVGVSAWKSSSPFVSWVGGGLQEYTSFLTFAALVVLFYLIVNVLSDRASHRFTHLILLLSTLCVAAFSVASLFFGSRTFNTIGTVNAAGIYLVVMASFAMALWISHSRTDSLLYEGKRGLLEQVVIALVTACTFFYLLVVDYWLLWMLLAVGMVVLFGFVLFRARDFPSVGRFVLPILLLIATLPFWFWFESPFSIRIPAEVTVSTTTSRGIAYRALERINPSYGSGPGTYPFVYAREHGIGVNRTEFFNTRFDRAASLYFTLLPTLGYLGFVALIVFLFGVGVRGFVHVARARSRENWLHGAIALVPWVVLLVAAGFYHFNLTLMFLVFLMSALVASQAMGERTGREDKRSRVAALAWSFVFTAGSLVFLVGIFLTAQRYGAEIAYAKAVRADREGAPLSEVVASLDTAATLNRYDDRAYRVLAQALLHRVNEQLASVSGATELTEESRAYVQALVASSVNAGVRATELSPQNSLNWLMRGSVYRELMAVVPGATGFSVSAFEKAIELEPNNPSNWNELGVTYLAAAERERPLTVAKEKQVAAQAKVLVEDYMKKAEAAFAKAIELKPNFAPAHYQLSLAYERHGRLDDAIGKMESVARYNLQDVGVAFQLGQLYMRRGGKGDVARAKASFEYAISLAPSYSNARWFLASIFEVQGDVRAAIEQVEKVLDLNPGNQLVKARLDRLLKGQTSAEAPTPLP